MDQILKTMKAEINMAFWFIWRRQSRPTWCPASLRLDGLKKTMVMAVNKEDDEDMDVDMYDCIVCLWEVSPIDEYRNLPNCEHGVKFHAHCIDAWLKDHSTCPICRSDISRLLSQRLHSYFCHRLLQDVISYYNSALDNVANSIGDCGDF